MTRDSHQKTVNNYLTVKKGAVRPINSWPILTQLSNYNTRIIDRKPASEGRRDLLPSATVTQHRKINVKSIFKRERERKKREGCRPRCWINNFSWVFDRETRFKFTSAAVLIEIIIFASSSRRPEQCVWMCANLVSLCQITKRQTTETSLTGLRPRGLTSLDRCQNVGIWI